MRYKTLTMIKLPDVLTNLMFTFAIYMEVDFNSLFLYLDTNEQDVQFVVTEKFISFQEFNDKL